MRNSAYARRSVQRVRRRSKPRTVRGHTIAVLRDQSPERIRRRVRPDLEERANGLAAPRAWQRSQSNRRSAGSDADQRATEVLAVLDELPGAAAATGRRRSRPAPGARLAATLLRLVARGARSPAALAVAVLLVASTLAGAVALDTWRQRGAAPVSLLPADSRDAALLTELIDPTGAAELPDVIARAAVGVGLVTEGASSPAAADGEPGGVRYHRYEVRRGDTLSGLADQFGISLDTIISFNDIRRARELRAGRLLVIPSAAGVRYVVRRGDTLSGIAARFGMSLNELLDANDIDSELITPGDALLVPDARLSENDRNRVLGHLFVWPSRGRLSSRYGYRNDPFTGIRKFHNGIDIANRNGTGVTAAMGGTIARVGYNGNYGRYVIMRHQDGFQTLYAHLDRILVSRGDTVRQGQRIAIMGNTGYSTGNHLHFSIFRGGEHLDPLGYLE